MSRITMMYENFSGSSIYPDFQGCRNGSCCDLSKYYPCDPSCIFARDCYKTYFAPRYGLNPPRPVHIGYGSGFRIRI